ncbi:MAG: glycosyltransferase [Deltaproteobacteria bacterium]|nr:glycosyltransferase [Deltaproteobacteria bacterium]
MDRKILIFGNFPFNSTSEFIDTNHFANYFASIGDNVDFVTPPAYVPDFCLFFLKNRLSTLKNYLHSSIQIRDNLFQYTPLSFLPIRNNSILGSKFNTKLFSLGFKSTSLSRKNYDICITSQGFMLIWSQYVNAKLFIYRYNDIIDGFKDNPPILNEYENTFVKYKSPIILAVNQRLAEYLHKKYPENKNIKILPNGVDIDFFKNAKPDEELIKIKKKKLVFCGGVDFWVDTDLLYETARRLTDSILIIIGPSYTNIDKLLSLPNVVYLGPKKYEQIPSLLKACDIGLIPFKKNRLTEFVEKPLKYYEYLAAGLMVISTGLAHTTEKNPYFKNCRDPQLFIETIEKTEVMKVTDRWKISSTVNENDWKSIFSELELIITNCLESCK